ncbi:hypothetical protein COY90_04900, partial [Candidatus Roizmanbacteria bacterium CG_4_10_14_0_8_um_filter_39_9]
MDDLLKLRQMLLKKTLVVNRPKTRGDLYQFLGNTKEERTNSLMKKILGENAPENKRKLFEYIVEFWERSTIEVPYKAPGF